MLTDVHDLIAALHPADDLEAAHRAEAMSWLASTTDVYRRIKPATPPRHLVSYVVPTDPGTDDVLLVDNRNARLWLPPGVHLASPVSRMSLSATAHRSEAAARMRGLRLGY